MDKKGFGAVLTIAVMLSLVDELSHSRALGGVHGCHGSQNAGL